MKKRELIVFRHEPNVSSRKNVFIFFVITSDPQVLVDAIKNRSSVVNTKLHRGKGNFSGWYTNYYYER